MIQDHRYVGAWTDYSTFDFGDLDEVYIRGYALFEDGSVNYSPVMEYHPKDFVVYIRSREDIMKIKGDDNEQTIRDISMFRGKMIFYTDMLPEDKDVFASSVNCRVEGNGHRIYISSVGKFGHIDNAVIGYCFQWDMRNYGIMTNCYFENSTHVINDVGGYIGKSKGLVLENYGTIETCEELTVLLNQGIVKNCYNPFYRYPEVSAGLGYIYIVQTNEKFGIIQNCTIDERFILCSTNHGVIQ